MASGAPTGAAESPMVTAGPNGPISLPRSEHRPCPDCMAPFLRLAGHDAPASGRRRRRLCLGRGEEHQELWDLQGARLPPHTSSPAVCLLLTPTHGACQSRRFYMLPDADADGFPVCRLARERRGGSITCALNVGSIHTSQFCPFMHYHTFFTVYFYTYIPYKLQLSSTYSYLVWTH